MMRSKGFLSHLDFHSGSRQMEVVGPHCSRPADPRHIAQALHLSPFTGPRTFGDTSDLHKSFVWSRHWTPGFRQPPGELSRAAKRCLTPKGDEICLALLKLTPRTVNAAAKMHRLAGAKIQSTMLASRPPNWGPSSDIRLGRDYPPVCPSWHGVSGSCSD